MNGFGISGKYKTSLKFVKEWARRRQSGLLLSGNERDNNFTSSMHELFRLLTPLLSLKFYFNTEKIQIHSGNNRPLLVL